MFFRWIFPFHSFKKTTLHDSTSELTETVKHLRRQSFIPSFFFGWGDGDAGCESPIFEAIICISRKVLQTFQKNRPFFEDQPVVLWLMSHMLGRLSHRRICWIISPDVELKKTDRQGTLKENLLASGMLPSLYQMLPWCKCSLCESFRQRNQNQNLRTKRKMSKASPTLSDQMFKNWGAIIWHSHNSHQILHQCRKILICKASNAKPWDHTNEVDGDVATPQILADF